MHGINVWKYWKLHPGLLITILTVGNNSVKFDHVPTIHMVWMPWRVAYLESGSIVLNELNQFYLEIS